MSGGGSLLEAIFGLIFGGIIFILFGRAISGTALDNSGVLANFELWGVIYILAALAVAVIAVIGVVGAASR